MGPRTLARSAPAALPLTGSRVPATVVGIEAWLIALVALPSPLIARMLLAAPLVVVPALLSNLPGRRLPLGLSTADLGPWPALLAALPLVAAVALPAGPLALALAVPWIALCGLVALAALVDGLLRLPALVRPANSTELATDAALGFVGIGALFLLAHRVGVEVLGFGSTLLLLGAVHYHFLGFGVLGAVAVAARSTPRLGFVAAGGIVVGMPLSGVGTLVGSAAANWLGVLAIGVGGWAAAIVLGLAGLRAAGGLRMLALLAAAAGLAAGVSLGVGWSSSLFFGFHYLDLETMVRTHGALNAAAVLLAALAVPAPTERDTDRRGK